MNEIYKWNGTYEWNLPNLNAFSMFYYKFTKLLHKELISLQIRSGSFNVQGLDKKVECMEYDVKCKRNK